MNRGKKSTLIEWESDYEFEQFYDYVQQKQQQLKVNKLLRREFKNKNARKEKKISND